jgi:protein O-mannosyl-transferase
MSRRKQSAAPLSEATADSAPRLPPLVAVGLIAAATMFAFWPALSAGLIWDDDGHVTKPELQSFDGLGRIWFELGATQQYYPLLHSLFWIEHRLWGDAPLGYHLANLMMHAAAAALVYANLRQLRIPGALLAALVFAVHPVQVETVAWVTEQKNTLSAIFYLAAMWFYVRFDADRSKSHYTAATTLFVLGLLSKTVTATLPAALLVVFWWQRGRLSWRRDVLPLGPWFLLGAIAGLFTAWVERTLIGAQGEAFQLSWIERGLLAGRVPWFYLTKLLWPANLTFVYPHWRIDPHDWGQWLYPAATLAVLLGLSALRRRWRAPLAGALLFVGTLFPVLGFVNVYPFQYSFVADHFQYLASLGVIVPVAAGLAVAWQHWLPGWPRLGVALATGLVLSLSVLSARQCRMYRDAETLYETTIARNPDCWLAYLNLGAVRLQANRPQEAVELYRHVLRIRPEYADAHANLGLALVALGQSEEGLSELAEAARLPPNSSQNHYRYGLALLGAGQAAAAASELAESARLFPNSSKIENNLGVALFSAGRIDEAIAAFDRAIELDPNFADAYENLLGTLAKSSPSPAATKAARRALSRGRSAGRTDVATRLGAWLQQARQNPPQP